MNTEDFKRKLIAILSADVQGYSRLMGEDEDSTVRTLTAYRALMSALIQKHRGHVVDTPGDNLLAEFGSVMDAVRCAVEVQEELNIRNAELPENRKMQFRIGINLGDIIEEGGRIYGDGINVAARVEGLAEGGGICISGSVYDSIRNKLSMSYDFLGEHTVKNIKEPVRVYRIRMEPEGVTPTVKEKKARLRTWQIAALVVAVFILGTIAYLVFDKYHLDRTAVEKEITTTETEQVPAVTEVKEAPKTIAVLPFDDLSPEKDQEYFVLGLSEEILNSLTQIPGLTVIAKTSSFSFKGKDKTIPEIASILGVDHILEGSVRKAGNALRITAQLVKAVDGSHLWSKIYDKEFKVEEMFSVQEDIANNVADKLKLTLEALNLLGGTDNVEAYELYLVAKGQQKWDPDPLVQNEMLKPLDAALALDPKFALAWAAKANVHSTLSKFGPANSADSELDAALNAAQRAIELEPKLGSGYYQLGFVKNSKGDWINAESAYRKALELPTGIISGYEIFIAIHYNAVGYFKKAHDLLKEMQQNDPLHQAVRAHYMLNLVFFGDTKLAEEEYKRGIKLFGGQWTLGDMYITEIRLGSFNVVPNDIIYSNPIFNLAREHLKSPEEGLTELHQIYKNGDNLSSADFAHIAQWAAYFRDPEFSMDAIEKTVNIDASCLFGCWEPVYREVRQLPRFKELVREIGLVDYWNQFGWPDICHKLDNGDFECD